MPVALPEVVNPRRPVYPASSARATASDAASRPATGCGTAATRAGPTGAGGASDRNPAIPTTRLATKSIAISSTDHHHRLPDASPLRFDDDLGLSTARSLRTRHRQDRRSETAPSIDVHGSCVGVDDARVGGNAGSRAGAVELLICTGAAQNCPGERVGERLEHQMDLQTQLKAPGSIVAGELVHHQDLDLLPAAGDDLVEERCVGAGRTHRPDGGEGARAV